ncbi:hypothetical protein P3342_003087 [Pyrenophora teres f. teres]|nr:hypothetical protein PTNB85_01006 [Pyrenophora teres f. teres]KAE8870048.1 hypothetical protein PTNB29_00392 [Pyrenophora teres f. teres]KAK1915280.1 hypothetical protein P3342_003087 [Pyrenophora teres f. teres]
MAGIQQASVSTTTLPPGTPLPTDQAFKPLTTPFVQPSDCTDHWTSRQDETVIRNSIPSSCTPDATSIHSPGTCMDGYYIANVMVYRTAAYQPGDDQLWVASCCRRDMTTTVFNANCVATITSSTVIYTQQQYVVLNQRSDGSRFFATSYDPVAHVSIVTTEGTLSMDPFIVYWQSSDLSKFNSDYASTLARYLDIDTTPKTTSASVTAQSRSVNPSATALAPLGSGAGEDSANPGLSPGAKAGIGVGAAIGAILLGLVGFLVYKKTLRSKSKLDNTSALRNDQPELRQANTA